MAWTYELTTLGVTPKDQVRLQLGDTVSTNPLLQDEEINFYLTQRSNIYGAAAECCRSLSARYSNAATAAAGGQKTQYSDLSKAYARRAVMFDAQASSLGSGMPYAGGISITDKLGQETNSDRVSPQFVIGMDDNTIPVPSLPVEAPDGSPSE